MTTSTSYAGRTALTLALVLDLPSASAQERGFSLQTLDPAPSNDTFFATSSATTAGAGQWSAGVLGAYAYKGVFTRDSVATRASDTILSSQLVLHADATYSFDDRLLGALNVPFVTARQGDATSVPDSAFGDARLTARFVLMRSPEWNLATQLDVFLPTGSSANWTSDGTPRAHPRLAASGRLGLFRYAANLGYSIREPYQLDDLEIGSALTLGGAVGLGLLEERLQVGLEVQAASWLGGERGVLAARKTPALALFGVRHRFESVVVGFALGPSLSEAPGSAPQALLTLAWSPERAAAPNGSGPTSSPEHRRRSTLRRPAAVAIPRVPPPLSPEPPATQAPPAPANESPEDPDETTAAEDPLAPDAKRLERARRLFRAGIAAFDLGKYPQAKEAFVQAHALRPHPAILMNVAQSEIMLGERAGACKHLRQVEADPSPDATPELKASAAREVARFCR